MKKAYIIGKYRDTTLYSVQLNIDRARDLAIQVWKKGYAVFCPHLNTAHFDGEMPDEVWLEGDVEWLECTDIAVCVDNYRDSKGSEEEIGVCSRRGIPVYYNIEDVPDES